MSAANGAQAIIHLTIRSDGSAPRKILDGHSVRSQYFRHLSFARFSVVNKKRIVKYSYPESLNIYAPLGCGL